MTKRLLILDPEVGFSAIANAAARSAGWDSQHIDNPEEALSALSSDSFGALLMPAEIEEAGAADFLKEVRALPGRFLLDVIFLGDSFDFGRRTHNLPLPLPASDLTSLLKSFDVKPGELNLEIDAFEEAMFRITGDMESEEAVAPADGEGEPEKVELSEEAILENGTPPDESDDEIAATTPAGTDEEEMPEPEQEAESDADAELPGDEPAVAESQEPSRPDKVLLLEEGWILTDKGGEFDLFAFRVDKDEAGGTFKEPAFGLADITEPPSEPSEDEKLEAALHTIEEEVDEEEAIKALGERAEEEELQEEPSEEEPSEEEPSEEESSAEEASAEELFEEEPQAGSEQEPATFNESASVSEDEDKRLEDKFLSLTLAEEGETEDEGEDLVSGPSGEAGAIELPVVEEELPPAEETIPEPEAVSFIEDSVTEEELILEEAADGSGDLSLEVGEATDEATGREPDSFELEETFRALTGAAEAGLTQDDEIKPLTPEEEVEAADALATELVESTEDDIFTALDDALDVFDEDDSVASERASSDDAPAPVDEFDLGIEFAEGEELFTEPVKASEDIEGEAVDMPAPFPDDDPFAAELALEFHDSTHRELIDFSFDRAESEVGIYAAALAPDFEKLKRDESLPEVDSLHPASETQSIIPELDIDDSWAIASEDDDSFDLDIDSYFEKFERED